MPPSRSLFHLRFFVWDFPHFVKAREIYLFIYLSTREKCLSRGFYLAFSEPWRLDSSRRFFIVYCTAGVLSTCESARRARHHARRARRARHRNFLNFYTWPYRGLKCRTHRGYVFLGRYVMYGHILCPQYILCPILYIQYPTHTYRAKQGCTQLYTAIHCYTQLYTAIQS